MPVPPILVLTGPTAVGKSALSIRLAEALGAEIISADSRQVYRELTIGTAKPDAEQLRHIKHHFIDELTLEQPFSAGIFLRDAVERINTISSKGKRVIVVGGSTLYIHALLHGLAHIPPIDTSIRTELEARLQREGSRSLYDELHKIDSQSTTTLDHTKTQRVVRALEVYYGTGNPFSSYFTNISKPGFNFIPVILTRDRPALYERINQRVDLMLDMGLLEEVKTILKQGFDASLYPLKSIGYREAIMHIKNEVTYAEMTRLIKRNTRRYAKRQITWFKRYKEMKWMQVNSETYDKLFFKLQ